MTADRIGFICRDCGGSGTNPPGSPMYTMPIWANEQSRFIGWGYVTHNTAPIPRCYRCRGTGMEPEGTL